MQGSSLRDTALVSLAFLAILAVGAVFFYRERMLFTDAAYISFHAINGGQLQIQVERYGAFITQMWPVMGSKLGLSLKAILILYSLSFNLFYLAAAFLLYRLRAYALVILLSLYLSLFVSQTYFWTNNEVHQGITWMFLMFGTIQYIYSRSEKHGLAFHVLSLLLFLPLALLAIYSHPLVMIPTVFLWLFLIFTKKDAFFSTRLSWVYGGIIIVICAIKYYTSTNNLYDGSLLGNVLKSGLPEIIGTFTGGMADIFWKGLVGNHYFVPILFVAGLVYLAKRKRYILATYTAIACLAYFILVCLTFNGGYVFYVESEWMCLTILATSVFTYFILPEIKPRNAVLLLSFMFLVRLAYIAYASKIFTARIDRIEYIVGRMKQMALTKAIIVREDDRLENELFFAWALPLETMYTSILNKDTIRTVTNLTNEEISSTYSGNSKKDFITPFRVISYSDLNRAYFPLDTINSYRRFSYEQFFEGK